MRAGRILLSTAGGAAILALLLPTGTDAFTTLGNDLPVQTQRHFRVYHNFTDATANDNQTADAHFPGYTGAEMAIWKACVEWGSRLHGDGGGDPHQPAGLGSGGANFDPSWQGNAPNEGTANDNVHSELVGGGGGIYAFCEQPGVGNGWRIRYYSEPWIWDDNPSSLPGGRVDLQGIAAHEYGHALGLGHSGTNGATMVGSVSEAGSFSNRSIATDDINGVQAIYSVASPTTKPVITGISQTMPGMVTITGLRFDGSNNEVWFTKSGTGGDGTPVKAFNVPSSGGGTSITTTVPANAGPGDLLVRKPGTAHSVLSNAWPFDPNAGPNCMPTSFCSTSPNSVGPGAVMGWDGSTSIADNEFQLSVVGLPVGTVGLFYAGNQQAGSPAPFGNGLNCVTGPVLRFGAAFSDALGSAFFLLDFSTYPGNQMSANGTQWLFQFWYRNPAGGGAGFNTSDGIKTRWCP